MKKHLIKITFILLAAIAATAAIWWFNRPVTLVDLQKRYLFAKTQEEKDKIIDQLEEYYLNLPVPDTLRQRVEREVAMIIDTTKINPATFANGMAADTNVYKLESQLQNLLYLTAIARAREESQMFSELMKQAKMMAKTVDVGTQNDYWVKFVDRVALFDKAQAEEWLKADLAQARCRAYQDSESQFMETEFYASLGLKSLQRASDERLQLDFMQRLQFILYFYRSMNELSLGLAKKSLPKAEEKKYHLRSTGIIYHQAEALARIGNNQSALSHYDKVLDNAARFRKITNMHWFAIAGLLERGYVYLKMGEFQKALEACSEVENHELDSKTKITLHILQSDIFRFMADYEQAEKELRSATALATAEQDTFHLMTCLNNFGVMFERLSDYDLALDYYMQAKSLFKKTNKEVFLYVLVLNNIADIAVTKKDFVKFEEMSEEARKLLQYAIIPSREAQLLQNIGNMHKKAEKFGSAIKYFQQAASIHNGNGLIPYDLGTKIDLVDCLISLSRFDEAKGMLSEIESSAKDINDIERVIEAIGRRARIQNLEGKTAQAIESSNQFLDKIEELSSRFDNIDLLMSYRQKIYDFLKDAVSYEIAFQRRASAFVKLNYAKAYALKNQFTNGQENHDGYSITQKHFSIDSVIANLDEKSLVIDYMITKDTLYAFLLGQEGLQLLRKKVAVQILEKTVTSYKSSLHGTIRVLQNYDINKLTSHYAGTVATGQKLYEYLLGWPEIEARLPHVRLLYIIPDEFLYEVPFSTLITKSSDSQSFVVSQVAIVVLPGASFLQTENSARISNKPSTKRVLISADQRFPITEKFVLRTKALFPLTEELTVDSNSFTQNDVLKKLQGNYQIYIFIGHGAANKKYSDRSYIELPVRISNTSMSKTIRMTLADFKKINWLGTELVMLVGCETAGGKLYRGTGISGLYQAFLSLGAQNVLGNLWEVDANHAVSQAENFLFTWAATGNPAYSLQKCQLQSIQELEGHNYYQKPHPYIWGSSTLLTVKPH